MSDAVAARLRHHGYRGRTVQLKVRFRDFRTITRSTTLPAATDRGTEVLGTAWAMLERLPVDARRAVWSGSGCSNLGREAAPEQLTFDARRRATDGTRRTRSSTRSGTASATD